MKSGLCAEDVRKVSQTFVKEVFGYSFQALAAWKRDDSFKDVGIINEDESWDFVKLVRWREEKRATKSGDEKKDLEVEKLKREIEIKDIQIAKDKAASIDRETHEAILASRQSLLTGFLTHAFVQNSHKFFGKSLDELRIIAADFARQALAVWTGRDGKNIKK